MPGNTMLSVNIYFLIMSTTLTICALDSKNDLDPFDMVNFDQVLMRMKNKKMPQSEEAQIPQLPAQSPVVHAESLSQADVCRNASPCECLAVEKTIEPCFALALFRQLVSRVMLLTRAPQSDDCIPADWNFRLRLAPCHFIELDAFQHHPSKENLFSAHAILTEAMQDAGIVASDHLPQLSNLERLGITMETTMQAAIVIVLMLSTLVLLSRIQFSYHVLVWSVFLGFLISVFTTWYRLYKTEVAEQHRLSMTLPPDCANTQSEAGSVWSFLDLFRYYFTFKEDKCIKYYENLIVSPIVKVSLMEALSVSVAQTLLRPMRTVGTEFGELIRHTVKDLPVQWQLFSVTSLFVLIIVCLLLTFRYRIRVPFLMAIEPAPTLVPDVDVKLLLTKVQDLQARIDSAVELKQIKHDSKEYLTNLKCLLRHGHSTVSSSADSPCLEFLQGQLSYPSQNITGSIGEALVEEVPQADLLNLSSAANPQPSTELYTQSTHSCASDINVFTDVIRIEHPRDSCSEQGRHDVPETVLLKPVKACHFLEQLSFEQSSGGDWTYSGTHTQCTSCLEDDSFPKPVSASLEQFTVIEHTKEETLPRAPLLSKAALPVTAASCGDETNLLKL